MDMSRYDTYCGIYCGACEIMNAKTDDEKTRVIHMFESNVPGWQATIEQIHCSGCKTDDVFVNCAICPIRPCAKDKGVEFCIECNEFPCQMHNQLQMASDYIPVLKHLKANIKNQEYIKSNGLEKWLADQENKWKCPDCGTHFAWYTEECPSCNRNLKGTRDYE